MDHAKVASALTAPQSRALKFLAGREATLIKGVEVPLTATGEKVE